MATPIYSPLPSYFENNEEALVAYYTGKLYRSHELYPALDWALEETPGTVWRNIHSGACAFIGGLSQTDEGPVPIAVYPYQLFEDQFGFWRQGRFIVEDWVRVDHLSPQIELNWFGVELKYLQMLIDAAEFEQELAEGEADFQINGEIIIAANEAVNTVMARLYDFLDEHDLTNTSPYRKHLHDTRLPYFGFVPGEQVVWQN